MCGKQEKETHRSQGGERLAESSPMLRRAIRPKGGGGGPLWTNSAPYLPIQSDVIDVLIILYNPHTQGFLVIVWRTSGWLLLRHHHHHHRRITALLPSQVHGTSSPPGRATGHGSCGRSMRRTSAVASSARAAATRFRQRSWRRRTGTAAWDQAAC